MGGTAASRITAAISGTNGTVLGAAVGNEGVTLAIGAIPSHDHTAATGFQSADHVHGGTTGGRSADHSHGVSDPTHAHNVRYVSGDYNTGQPGASDQPYQTIYDVATWSAGTGVSTAGVSVDHSHGITTGGASANHTHAITAQGGGGTHLNMGPTIIVNKILRVL